MSVNDFRVYLCKRLFKKNFYTFKKCHIYMHLFCFLVYLFLFSLLNNKTLKQELI